MIWLIIGLILFLGMHSVRMALPGLREVLWQAWGENAWKGIYSLVSLLGIILVVWGFGLTREQGVQVYDPPSWGLHVTLFLMFISFSLLPFNMRSSRLRPLIKNPFLLAVALWSIGHLLANGDLASVLLFGSFLLWTLANRLSLTLRPDVAPAAVPLVQDIVAVGAAWLIYLLFLFVLHEWLFGVAPVAV